MVVADGASIREGKRSTCCTFSPLVMFLIRISSYIVAKSVYLCLNKVTQWFLK